MADDRMRKDDEQRNMGTKDDQDFARQSPGRGGQMGHEDDRQAPGQQSGQKGARNLDDDEDLDTGKSGGQNRGGQDR